MDPLDYEENIMSRMLSKGDKLRPKYEGFEFSNLDAKTTKWLNRLSVFTQYRQFLINRCDEGKASNDIKVLFIEQHSIKLPPKVFYDLEHDR